MGKATERFDSEGREKVRCHICSNYYHRVDVHVGSKHGLTVEEYTRRFPGASILSDFAKSESEVDETIAELPPPPKAKASKPKKAEPDALRFGIAKLHERQDDLAPYDLQFIPVHDEHWVPGVTETTNLEYLAMGIEDDENVLIVGPPGVGKTTLARELAAICNQPLRRLPFNGEMRTSDLLGMKDLVVDPSTGQTVTKWTNGPLPDAAEHGHWVLFDEFDSAPPQVAFVLHSVLERPRQLTIMTTGQEVKFHDKFRVVATANTLGYGDETGLYAGTGPMNEALLDRFGVVIRVDYPTKEDELKILVERTGVKDAWAALMVDVAWKVREAQKNQTSMVSVSPRRLIAWASKSVRLGNPRRAAQITLINKLPPDDAKFIDGVIQRHFGGSV